MVMVELEALLPGNVDQFKESCDCRSVIVDGESADKADRFDPW